MNSNPDCVNPGSEHALRPLGALDIHPDVLTLQARCNTLRGRLSELLEMESTLAEHVAPHLEAIYLEQLGRLELTLLQAQARNASLRRRLELIRAYLNRGEIISLARWDAIEAQIRREQFEWEERLRADERRLREATLRLSAPRLGERQVLRLKQLYRRLVRQLHPDMTGRETLQYRKYWNEVQIAYRNGDLHYLELLAEAINIGEGMDESVPITMIEQLEQEIGRLERLVQSQIERIANLRNRPPLCYERQLSDAGWVEQKRRDLAAAIRRENETQKLLEDELRMLLPYQSGNAGTLH